MQRRSITEEETEKFLSEPPLRLTCRYGFIHYCDKNKLTEEALAKTTYKLINTQYTLDALQSSLKSTRQRSRDNDDNNKNNTEVTNENLEVLMNILKSRRQSDENITKIEKTEINEEKLLLKSRIRQSQLSSMNDEHIIEYIIKMEKLLLKLRTLSQLSSMNDEHNIKIEYIIEMESKLYYIIVMTFNEHQRNYRKRCNLLTFSFSVQNIEFIILHLYSLACPLTRFNLKNQCQSYHQRR
jgi:hypothetical protein